MTKLIVAFLHFPKASKNWMPQNYRLAVFLTRNIKLKHHSKVLNDICPNI